MGTDMAEIQAFTMLRRRCVAHWETASQYCMAQANKYRQRDRGSVGAQ